jgi:hypothetical protein
VKAKVYRNLAGSQILNKAPPGLRGQVALRRFERESGAFTLLVFSTKGAEPVLSGAVKHALADLPESDRLVAFGGCFTLEALAHFRERGVEVFARSDFPWTDEGFGNTRTFIASPVKFPVK